ncbi:MAG: M1 family metallopeptidase [Promethearchaeia archaeon]
MPPLNNNPTHYLIHLKLDPQKEFFDGQVTIYINVPEKIDNLNLHIDNLKIHACKIWRKNEYIDCKFEEDQEEKELHIKFPEIVENGLKIQLSYQGKFQSDLLGMYKSKFEHNGKEQYVISTQFEEIYARRVFPCNDHPAKKATFSIELEIDRNLKAISNTDIESIDELEDDKKLIKFRKTPKMCPYLLYMGVGNFEIREQKGEYHVRLITTPGKTQYGDLAIDMAMKALKFCEDFTSTKYPLNKCDLIAVPDFPFGAMENWGAITFRENMLLVYPDKTSKLSIFNIASVVAHEISHFWFGNLVSPLDWKYIWLNESFASYFTYLIPDRYYPSWKSWEHYILQYYVSSLERDALNHTFPIEFLTDEEIFITPAKVGIIYNKGATILRMLISYLGKENFQKGVRHFMEKFQYQNASTENYWEALQTATGKEVTKFAESWILQSGFPLIQVNRENGRLILEQTKFSYLGSDSEAQWFIPLELKNFTANGKTLTERVVFNTSKKEFPLPEETECYKLNLGQKGFFRVEYDKPNLEKLGKLILDKTLSPLDRFGVENDLFALVKRGSFSVNYYLDFIEQYFIDEYDYLPLTSIFSHLTYSFKLKKSVQERLEKLALQLIDSFFEKYGYESREDEDLPVGILRNLLLWKGSVLGSEEILRFGKEKFKDLKEGKKLSPDILSSIYKIGALTKIDAIEYFLEVLDDSHAPQIEKVYIYQALGCVREKDKLKRVFDIIVEKIPPQSWLYTFRQLGSNTAALDLLWPWFKEKLSLFEKQSPFVLARTIATVVPMGGMPYSEEIDQFLMDYAEENEFHKDTIEMVLEQLAINLKFADET